MVLFFMGDLDLSDKEWNAAIHEILNGRRDYQSYDPDSDNPETLESIQELALGYNFNGPGGNEFILRLLEIIKAMMNGTLKPPSITAP